MWERLLNLLRSDPDCTAFRHKGVVERTSIIDPSPTRTRCVHCGKIKRYTGEWL